jgi:hypothetical protein
MHLTHEDGARLACGRRRLAISIGVGVHEAVEGRVLARELDVLVPPAADVVDRVAACPPRPLPGQVRLVRGGDRRPDEPVLVAEVVVERRRSDVGRLADGTRRELAVAGQELGRGLDQPLAWWCLGQQNARQYSISI